MNKKGFKFSSKYKKAKNKILNKPGHHSVASISYDVLNDYTAFLYNNPKENNVRYTSKCIDGSVTISDCNKAIILNFDFETKEEEYNAFYKIDSLIQILQDFRKDLLEGKNHRDNHQKALNISHRDRDDDSFIKVNLEKAQKIVNESNIKVKRKRSKILVRSSSKKQIS